jgi:hypothetical protein
LKQPPFGILGRETLTWCLLARFQVGFELCFFLGVTQPREKVAKFFPFPLEIGDCSIAIGEKSGVARRQRSALTAKRRVRRANALRGERFTAQRPAAKASAAVSSSGKIGDGGGG